MSAWDRLRPKTARGNRALALALLVALLGLGVALVAVPSWRIYRYYDDNATQFTRQLRSYTSLNQLRPGLTKSVEVLKASDTRKHYLKATTPALASAELQEVVKAVIEANGGRVSSVQPMTQVLKEDAGFKPTGITVIVVTNIQNLRKYLHALESRAPALFIDALTVRSQVQSGFKPMPGVEPEMFVQMDVIAYSPSSADAKSSTDGGKPIKDAKPRSPAPGANT